MRPLPRRRRRLATALAGLGLLTTTACGAGGIGSDTLVLEFPSWQASDESFAPWWRELIAAYEDENPDVEIDFYQVPFDSFVNQQATRFAAGDPPDVVHLPSSNVIEFAARDWLAPLDDRLAATDILQTWTPLQEQMELDGQSYGVLLLGYGYAMFYNEALLEQAAVDVPTTPEELLTAARAVSALDGDAFGFGATTSQNPDNYTELTSFVVGNGGSWSDVDGAITADDPVVATSLQQYRDVLAEAPRGILSQQRNELFLNGQVAMLIDGPFLLPELAGAAPDVQGDLHVAPPPFATVPGGVSNSIHVPADADPEVADATWDLIELASRPQWQERYSELTAVPAPREGSVTPEALEATPELELFAELAEDAVDIFPEAPELRSEFGRVGDVVSGAAIGLIATDTAVEQIVRDIQQGLEAIENGA